MQFGVPTFSSLAEGMTAGGVMRELLADPARSKNPCTYEALHAREPGGPIVTRRVGRRRVVRGTLRR